MDLTQDRRSDVVIEYGTITIAAGKELSEQITTYSKDLERFREELRQEEIPQKLHELKQDIDDVFDQISAARAEVTDIRGTVESMDKKLDHLLALRQVQVAAENHWRGLTTRKPSTLKQWQYQESLAKPEKEAPTKADPVGPVGEDVQGLDFLDQFE